MHASVLSLLCLQIYSSYKDETGCDLGPFAAMLQCLHLDTPLLEQKNTKKLYVIKKNKNKTKIVCVSSWGKFWTEDTKRLENLAATFAEPGGKSWVSGAKLGSAHTSCTQYHVRG